MNVEISILSGQLAGRTVVFPDCAQVVIGRHESCDLVLKGDGISRQHCRLLPGLPPTVEDLGSKNGTGLNGHRLPGPGQVNAQDTVHVGSVTLQVLCRPATLPASNSDDPPTEVIPAPGPGPLLEATCSGCGCSLAQTSVPQGQATLCESCRRQLDAGGEKIGEFTILQQVGEGATAKVYRAMDPGGGLAALKVFNIDPGKDEPLLQRIVRESKLTSSLQHPNIVRMIDAGVDGSTLFVAYEYVHGGDLTDAVGQAGTLDPRRLVHIGRQMCSALGHAHSQGIVHRDLKPANVLLCAGDVVKVTDFGIAKPLDQAMTAGLTRSGQTLGTPCYMPPEQKGSARHADQKSDLYSLGATLFNLATGQPPLEGSVFQVFEALENDKPVRSALELRPDLPPLLDMILRRSMEKDPARRFRDAAEFEAVLTQVATLLGSA